MKNHSKILTAILAGSLALGSVGAGVSAATDVTHRGSLTTPLQVREISGMTVTLVDGSSYDLPYGYDLNKLHVGDRVLIKWTQGSANDNRDATSVVVF